MTMKVIAQPVVFIDTVFTWLNAAPSIVAVLK